MTVKNRALLLQELWSCPTRDDCIALITRAIGGCHTEWLARDLGASGRVELAPSPLAALVEGVTNAADANIARAQKDGFFEAPPQSLDEALVAMRKGGPKIGVFHHKGVRDATVTIVDEGTGMNEREMIAGVLGFGSQTKHGNRLAHGHYGQGGATLFHHSREFSLVVSRPEGQNYWLFAPVFRKEAGDTMGYAYATEKDNRLFRAYNVDATYAFDERPACTANMLNLMFLPKSGTVRRQVGMKLEHSANRKSPSIEKGLPDRLFGFAGEVKITGAGALHKFETRVGRRHTFGVQPKWQPLAVIAPRHEMIPYDGRELPVTLRVWVIQNDRDEEGNLRPPATGMLDASDEGDGSHQSIFITNSGQTHARMRSSIICKNANLPYLAANMIVEIGLDNVPPMDRRMILPSTRNQINDDFAEALKGWLPTMLGSDPELRRCNDEMRPKASGAAINGTDFQKHLMPVLERINRQVLKGEKFADFGNVPNPEGKDGTHDVGPYEGRGASGTSSGGGGSSRVLAPIPPKDPAVMLHVSNCSLAPGESGVIMISTDVAEVYEDLIAVAVDPMVRVVSRAPMQGGRIRLQVRLDESAMLGEQFPVTATFVHPNLRRNPNPLTHTGYVSVRLPHTRRAGSNSGTGMRLPGGESSLGPPKIELVAIPEMDLLSWFGASDTPQEHAWSFVYDGPNHTLKVGYWPKFPFLDAATRTLSAKAEAATAVPAFLDRYGIQIAYHAVTAMRDMDCGSKEALVELDRMAISTVLGLSHAFEDGKIRTAFAKNAA